MLHLPEHLGPNDRVGLEHLEDEDRGPAEDKDRDHHDKHRDDGLHVRLGPIRAKTQILKEFSDTMALSHATDL